MVSVWRQPRSSLRIFSAETAPPIEPDQMRGVVRAPFFASSRLLLSQPRTQRGGNTRAMACGFAGKIRRAPTGNFNALTAKYLILRE